MKRLLLLILFVFLFAPIAQQSFTLFRESSLKGSFVAAADTRFSWKKWMNGDYQQVKEKYLNENFGFRTTLVRLYNEYRYRLFRLSTNAEAVFGKDDMFLAQTYIDSYVGKDYIGHDNVIKLSKQLKTIQDSLAAMNVTLIPVLAPNKARVYKEYIPDRYLPAGMSNYEDIATTFREQRIKFIDFNALFMKTRDTSPYPLFSRYGIHWSVYGVTMATDSIVKYVEKERGIELPVFNWKENIELDDSLRGLDYDIGEAMNLLTPQLPSQKMGYPKISFAKRDRTKPTLMVIGDSFYFGIQDTKVPDSLFTNNMFLYYFTEMRTPTWSLEKDVVKKMSIMKEVKAHDVIIIICTEHNMDTYGWEFIERAYASVTRDAAIKAAEAEIRSNHGWMRQISQKARDRGISIDEMVTLDARYLLDQQKK